MKQPMTFNIPNSDEFKMTQTPHGENMIEVHIPDVSTLTDFQLKSLESQLSSNLHMVESQLKFRGVPTKNVI